MKHLPLFAALATSFVLPAAVSHAAEEQPQHPAKPMLWKVEGGKLAKPSYLFGTIHLGYGPLARLHPTVAKAIDGADAIYTELPMDVASQTKAAQGMMRQDGKTLDEAIGNELAARLDAAVKRINPNLDAALFQPMKTWVAPLLLGTLEGQLKGGQPVDVQVWQRAEKAGKETAGLEDLDAQTKIFDDLTDEEQIQFVAESLRVMEEEQDKDGDVLGEMVALYAAGEAEKIDALVEREIKKMADGKFKELGQRLVRKLIDERDANMARAILKEFAGRPDKVHFFAVGTGHYIGNDSIISHLEKAGYKVTRVDS